jgi:UDP-N-acetylglucosamine 4,6-dehydratase
MYFRRQVVLVVGGTGSFGKRFVQRILEKDDPAKVIVFSRDELKQYELGQNLTDPRLRFFIGDVRDHQRLLRAFSGVDVVVHAAAMKQVPTCEYNPFEAVRTNIIGSENVINAAIDTGVKSVIAISTDKAVNPINLYGATKLCAEKMFIQGNSYSTAQGTRFACARYGNVVGSRGSVIPLFKKQREQGFVTITDERMTRFWITLGQAVDFVRRVTALMEGGEVFVPKIPSTRITDLAKVIAPDCDRKVVGIRPGEKIHESLITEDDAPFTLEDESYYLVQPRFPWWRTPQSDGREKVPPGFAYTSDNNSWWLSDDEIRDYVADA